MTENPACCTPNSSLTEVARLMVDNDCGEIPVVEDMIGRRLAGVITDRDIATRIVAQGQEFRGREGKRLHDHALRRGQPRHDARGLLRSDGVQQDPSRARRR
jgi:CBS domain-containing protein